MEENPVISLDEFKLFGCPKCGFGRSAQLTIDQETGATLKECIDCELIFVVVPEGVTISPFVFGGVHPNLQRHPRHGHLKKVELADDLYPFFHFKSGGISFGRARAPCFVCGRKMDLAHGLTAIINDNEKGEQLVAFFDSRVLFLKADYWRDQPQIQVFVCGQHLENLRFLQELVAPIDLITLKLIIKACAFPNNPT